MLTKIDLSIEFDVGGFGTIISLVLLLAAIGILVFIARELDQSKKRKLSGIILMLLSILFFLAQVSFLLHPEERYKNWCGLFGHYSSYALFWLIGFYIFIIPILLGYAGYVIITDEEKTIGKSLLFFIPIGVIADTVAALFMTATVTDVPSGGMLGSLISRFLTNYFGDIGTYLILGCSIIVVVLMMIKEKVFPKIKTAEVIDEIKKIPKKRKERKQKKEETAIETEVVQKPERKPARCRGTR